jgi:hypothetical protein
MTPAVVLLRDCLPKSQQLKPLSLEGGLSRLAQVWFPAGEFPLIGRDRELVRLRDALLNRRSLLILGAPGIGKSRLLEAVRSVTAKQARPVTVRFPAHPHDLLVTLASALLDDGHKALTASRNRSNSPLDRETSVHLRGILWQALALEPRPIIFEDIRSASAQMYRFLQPLFHKAGMCMIATAASVDRLGFLHRLFWDPRDHLELKSLRDHDAEQLASLAAERFQLPTEIDRSDLQQKVLDAAAGNPGRIIEMYRLAADSRYHSGDYVKLALIQIDLAARFTV